MISKERYNLVSNKIIITQRNVHFWTEVIACATYMCHDSLGLAFIIITREAEA